MPAENDAENFFEDLNKSLALPETNPPLEAEEELNPNPEDKPDDFVPSFERPGKSSKKTEEKPPTKTRDESIADLRKRRDAAEGALKSYMDLYGEKPETMKDLVDYLKENIEGPLTPDNVKSFLAQVKDKDEQLGTYRSQYEEAEKKVKDLDIRASKEFQEGYHKPYMEAGQNLFAAFASLGAENKILGPKSATEFHQFLMTGPDGLQVKAAYKKYAEAFRAETGEDPEPLDLTTIMSGVRNFAGEKTRMETAYTTWESSKREEADQMKVKRSRDQEELNKTNRRERINLVSKAFSDFDFDSVDGILDEDTVKKSFQEETRWTEDILFSNDPAKIPSYDKMFMRNVQANLYPKLLEKLKELIAERDDAVAAVNASRGSKGAPFKPSSKTPNTNEEDWLTGKPMGAA